jgi:cyanophycinase
MSKYGSKITFLLLASFLIATCSFGQNSQDTATNKGKLFIIGGGKRPPALIQELIHLSGIDKAGEIIILPMASGEPDTAAFYGTLQFTKAGIPSERIHTMHLQRTPATASQLDRLIHAQLIYITGGDQNRFMKVVLQTPIYEAIHVAYRNGATIAGTSAGAAVMTKKMITGNEFKHPEYTGAFRTIEADNMEIKEGLGLLPNAIVDQHFVYRMRMNRLMTVALENPNDVCIGIDESTALVIENNRARVVGESQIVVILNPKEGETKNGLLGGSGMQLSVYLPGEEVMELK